jgi:chromosome segregation ATPase
VCAGCLSVRGLVHGSPRRSASQRSRCIERCPGSCTAARRFFLGSAWLFRHSSHVRSVLGGFFPASGFPTACRGSNGRRDDIVGATARRVGESRGALSTGLFIRLVQFGRFSGVRPVESSFEWQRSGGDSWAAAGLPVHSLLLQSQVGAAEATFKKRYNKLRTAYESRIASVCDRIRGFLQSLRPLSEGGDAALEALREEQDLRFADARVAELLQDAFAKEREEAIHALLERATVAEVALEESRERVRLLETDVGVLHQSAVTERQRLEGSTQMAASSWGTEKASLLERLATAEARVRDVEAQSKQSSESAGEMATELAAAKLHQERAQMELELTSKALHDAEDKVTLLESRWQTNLHEMLALRDAVSTERTAWAREREELVGKFRQSLAAAEALDTELEGLRQEQAEAEHTMEGLRERVEEGVRNAERLRASEERTQRLEHDVASLKEALAEREEAVRVARQESERARGEVSAGLRAADQSAQERIREAEAAAEGRVKEAERRCTEAERAVLIAENQAAESSKLREAAEVRLEQAEAAEREALDRVEGLREQVQQLKVQSTDTLARLEGALETAKDVRERERKMEQELMGSREAMERLRSQLQDAIQQGEKDVESIAKDAETRIEALKTVHRHETESWQARENQYQEELESANEELQRMSEMLRQSRATMIPLAEHRRLLEEARETVKHTVAIESEAVARASRADEESESLTQMRMALDSSRVELTQSRQEGSRFELSLQAAREEISRLKRQREEEVLARTACEHQLSEVRDTLRQSEQQMQEAREQWHEAEQRAAAAATRAQLAAQRAEATEASFAAAEGDTSSKRTSLVEMELRTVSEEADRLRGELLSARDATRAAEGRAADEARAVKSALDAASEAERRLLRLQDDYEALQKRLSEAELKAKEDTARLANYRNRTRNWAATRATLRHSMTRKASELRTLVLEARADVRAQSDAAAAELAAAKRELPWLAQRLQWSSDQFSRRVVAGASAEAASRQATDLKRLELAEAAARAAAETTARAEQRARDQEQARKVLESKVQDMEKLMERADAGLQREQSKAEELRQSLASLQESLKAEQSNKNKALEELSERSKELDRARHKADTVMSNLSRVVTTVSSILGLERPTMMMDASVAPGSPMSDRGMLSPASHRSSREGAPFLPGLGEVVQGLSNHESPHAFNAALRELSSGIEAFYRGMKARARAKARRAEARAAEVAGSEAATARAAAEEARKARDALDSRCQLLEAQVQDLERTGRELRSAAEAAKGEDSLRARISTLETALQEATDNLSRARAELSEAQRAAASASGDARAEWEGKLQRALSTADEERQRCEKYAAKTRQLREELLHTAAESDRAIAEHRSRREAAETALSAAKSDLARAIAKAKSRSKLARELRDALRLSQRALESHVTDGSRITSASRQAAVLATLEKALRSSKDALESRASSMGSVARSHREDTAADDPRLLSLLSRGVGPTVPAPTASSREK